MMNTQVIRVSDYDVVLGENILSDIATTLIKKQIRGKIFIITDNNVRKLYLNEVESSLTQAGYKVDWTWLAAGEQSKTMENCVSILGRLAELNFNRDDTILALGGGVIGDLAGFVAATYLRGINLVHVPTTLMAQVDSSIGGKTGVNLPRGKNLVGSFYNPKLVYTDISTLKTLSDREFRSGVAEIIKYGIMIGGSFFTRIEKGVYRNEPELSKDLNEIVEGCIRYKGDIVELDWKEERDKRILLNLGHTLGHAIEQASGYGKYTHGEAVAYGIRAVTALSHENGYCSVEDRIRIMNALIANQFLKMLDKDVSSDRIFNALLVDKKVDKNDLRWVAISQIGRVGLTSFSESDIKNQIENLKTLL